MIKGAGSDWVGISLLAGYTGMILQDPKSRSTATTIVDKMGSGNGGGGGEWGGGGRGGCNTKVRGPFTNYLLSISW